RLREERDAMGLSQPKFAAIAGTTKQTLFSWETDKTAPSASQLADFAAAGVDVVYILTGTRQAQSDASLTEPEQELVAQYRCLRPPQQAFILETVAALAAANGKSAN